MLCFRCFIGSVSSFLYIRKKKQKIARINEVVKLTIRGLVSLPPSPNRKFVTLIKIVPKIAYKTPFSRLIFFEISNFFTDKEKIPNTVNEIKIVCNRFIFSSITK